MKLTTWIYSVFSHEPNTGIGRYRYLQSEESTGTTKDKQHGTSAHELVKSTTYVCTSTRTSRYMVYRRTYLVSQYAVAYHNIHNKSFGKLSFVASEYGAKVNRHG
jgi:hypothetical protein